MGNCQSGKAIGTESASTRAAMIASLPSPPVSNQRVSGDDLPSPMPLVKKSNKDSQNRQSKNNSTNRSITVDMSSSSNAEESKRNNDRPTFNSKYTIAEYLDRGSFSTVFITNPISDPTINYAVKVIDKGRLHLRDRRHIMEEIKLVQLFDHPNIVKVIECIQDEEKAYIVMEYMEGGDLLYQLVTNFTEKEARDIIRNVLYGLKYLHGMDIVHRDLKPENLLLSTESKTALVKIADFGFATHLSKIDYSDRCGTTGYRAPEMCKREKYDTKVDIWSTGVIAHFLFTADAPPEDDTTLIPSFTEEVWTNVSFVGKEFVGKLLTIDQDTRPTVAEALNHPWMRLSDEELYLHKLDGDVTAAFRSYVARRRWKRAQSIVQSMIRWQHVAQSASSVEFYSPSCPS